MRLACKTVEVWDMHDDLAAIELTLNRIGAARPDGIAGKAGATRRAADTGGLRRTGCGRRGGPGAGTRCPLDGDRPRGSRRHCQGHQPALRP
jgi:hypothetical protein